MSIKVRGKELTLRGIKRFFELYGNDSLKSTGFWMNIVQRKQFDQRFSECKDFKAYFDLSKDIFGLMQHEPEIQGLLDYARSINPQYACEIGTYEGGTNFLISQSIPGIKMMIGLDLFVQNVARLKHFCHPGVELHYLNASSYTEETVSKVEGLLQGHKLDFLFIDGDHRYEGVKQDFLMYRHLVRDGGIIGFHDIMPDFNTRHGKYTGMWAGDVPVFWEKLKKAYPYKEFVKDREQDGLGIGALEYSSQIAVPTDL